MRPLCGDAHLLIAPSRWLQDAYNRLEEVEGGMEEADVVGGPDLGEEPIADFCIVYALIQVTGSRWSEIEDGTWTSFFEVRAPTLFPAAEGRIRGLCLCPTPNPSHFRPMAGGCPAVAARGRRPGHNCS